MPILRASFYTYQRITVSTRLSQFCNRIIEAGWLVALVVIPLHFNPSSHRLFEPDKMALLRSIAVMMALAWAIKAGGRWFSRKTKQERAAAASSEPRSVSLGRSLASHPIIVLVILFLVSRGRGLRGVRVWRGRRRGSASVRLRGRCVRACRGGRPAAPRRAGLRRLGLQRRYRRVRDGA